MRVRVRAWMCAGNLYLIIVNPEKKGFRGLAIRINSHEI